MPSGPLHLGTSQGRATLLGSSRSLKMYRGLEELGAFPGLSLVIHDEFNGPGSGQSDMDGWTPDVIDNGNTWTQCSNMTFNSSSHGFKVNSDGYMEKENYDRSAGGGFNDKVLIDCGSVGPVRLESRCECGAQDYFGLALWGDPDDDTVGIVARFRRNSNSQFTVLVNDGTTQTVLYSVSTYADFTGRKFLTMELRGYYLSVRLYDEDETTLHASYDGFVSNYGLTPTQYVGIERAGFDNSVSKGYDFKAYTKRTLPRLIVRDDFNIGTTGSLVGRYPNLVNTANSWRTYNGEEYLVGATYGRLYLDNDNGDFSKATTIDTHVSDYTIKAKFGANAWSGSGCGVAFAVTSAIDGAETFAKIDTSNGYFRLVEYSNGTATVTNFVSGISGSGERWIDVTLDGTRITTNLLNADRSSILASGTALLSIPRTSVCGVNLVYANLQTYCDDFRVYATKELGNAPALEISGDVDSITTSLVLDTSPNASSHIYGLTSTQIRTDFGVGFLFNSTANRDAFVASYATGTWTVVLNGDVGVTSTGWTFDTNVGNTRAYIRREDWASFPSSFPYAIGDPYALILNK